MSEKVRIYILAKEYNLESKEMIEILNKEFSLGIKSHMSSISGDDLLLVKEYLDEIKNNSNKNGKKDDITEKKDKSKIEINIQDKKDDISNTKNNLSKKTDELLKDNNQRKKNQNNKKKQRKKKDKKKKNMNNSNNKKIINDGVIEVPESMTVTEFSNILNINSMDVIKALIKNGVMSGLNDQIDFETAELIALDFDKQIKIEEKLDENQRQRKELDYEDDLDDLVQRAPVVSVMGHVDHGKTSLLDYIRKTRVTKGEAGGITQHIGASIVNYNGHDITFLDTPGHEAFTEMRLRGAKSTDIAILVVAADDGVMPQTIEAIDHAKAADIPIIVAVNKMDKPDANPQRVMQQLMEHGIVPESWGGDTIMVEVSAKTGKGIDELLEMVLLVAEMQDLKANPNRNAVGIVVEAQLDKTRGTEATVLVQKGTLNTGDYVVSGSSNGRIRAMFDFNGDVVESAGPSIPVQVLGLSEVPEAGDHIYAVDDEKTAREFATKAAQEKREEHLKQKNSLNLDNLYEEIQSGKIKVLNIIIKTDVKGTLDAVENSVSKLSSEEVKISVIRAAVGGITESDVLLAQASNAIIIGFNIRPTIGAMQQAKETGVDIRTYSVIYEAIEDIENAVKGLEAPKYKEETLGRAEVKETFKVPGAGIVAGVQVTDGKLIRNAKIRLIRDNIIIYDGDVSSMRRFKDDVKELNQGFEGGVGLNNFNDIKVGDEFEAYNLVEIKRD
ncbi:MAG: translation initiation factor IF-2 [Peptoniphilaceae bacterium]|nr:translation initiation factor IF-2 [Peptoniphilaceae bacterium]MDY3737746.1 translation initiation factor IF-2 [Peptoniphilaceae bacterium]